MGSAVRAAVVAACALLPLLAGCTATAQAPPAAVAPTAAASSAPAGDPELARFTRVARAVVRAEHAPGGMDFVHALERAGWPRGALQVTADRTSVGLAVPAVQFAARSGRSCLIGQYGDAGLRVQRAAPVDGACLIGGTRALG